MNRDFVWWGRGRGIRVEGVCETLQPAFIIRYTYWGCASLVCSCFVCLQWPILIGPSKTKKKKKTLILCKLSKMEVSIGWWSAFPLVHHSIMGTQFKERGNGYYGEGLCYQLQNSIGDMEHAHKMGSTKCHVSKYCSRHFWAFFERWWTWTLVMFNELLYHLLQVLLSHNLCWWVLPPPFFLFALFLSYQRGQGLCEFIFLVTYIL